MKKYIRFGRIPTDGISKAHRGDEVLWSEKGVSVYNSVIVNGVYFPVLPPNPSESAYADYFYFLFSNKRVFVVTGNELAEKGSSGEPLLKNVEILEEITEDYEYLKSIHTRNRIKIENEEKNEASN